MNTYASMEEYLQYLDANTVQLSPKPANLACLVKVHHVAAQPPAPVVHGRGPIIEPLLLSPLEFTCPLIKRRTYPTGRQKLPLEVTVAEQLADPTLTVGKGAGALYSTGGGWDALTGAPMPAQSSWSTQVANVDPDVVLTGAALSDYLHSTDQAVRNDRVADYRPDRDADRRTTSAYWPPSTDTWKRSLVEGEDVDDREDEDGQSQILRRHLLTLTRRDGTITKVRTLFDLDDIERRELDASYAALSAEEERDHALGTLRARKVEMNLDHTIAQRREARAQERYYWRQFAAYLFGERKTLPERTWLARVPFADTLDARVVIPRMPEQFRGAPNLYPAYAGYDVLGERPLAQAQVEAEWRIKRFVADKRREASWNQEREAAKAAIKRQEAKLRKRGLSEAEAIQAMKPWRDRFAERWPSATLYQPIEEARPVFPPHLPSITYQWQWERRPHANPVKARHALARKRYEAMTADQRVTGLLHRGNWAMAKRVAEREDMVHHVLTIDEVKPAGAFSEGTRREALTQAVKVLNAMRATYARRRAAGAPASELAEIAEAGKAQAALVEDARARFVRWCWALAQQGERVYIKGEPLLPEGEERKLEECLTFTLPARNAELDGDFGPWQELADSHPRYVSRKIKDALASK